MITHKRMLMLAQAPVLLISNSQGAVIGNSQELMKEIETQERLLKRVLGTLLDIGLPEAGITLKIQKHLKREET